MRSLTTVVGAAHPKPLAGKLETFGCNVEAETLSVCPSLQSSSLLVRDIHDQNPGMWQELPCNSRASCRQGILFETSNSLMAECFHNLTASSAVRLYHAPNT